MTGRNVICGLLLLGLLGALAACEDRAVGLPDTCGDGVLDAWEACDGADLGGATCISLGFESGEVSCNANCALDTAECAGRQDELCGDGVCQPSEDPVNCPQDCSGVELPPLADPWGTEGQWWLVAHPNYPSTYGPGIHLVDTNTGQLLQTVELPAGAESPHGLAATADELWLSDMSAERIYRIRVSDGHSEVERSGVRTEGLALTATGYWSCKDLWTQGQLWLEHRLFNGGVDLSFLMESSVVSDLAYDGRFVYFVVNDGDDAIQRLDPLDDTRTIVVPHTTDAISTVAFDGEALVIDSDNGNLLRYDMESGALLDQIPHGITQGWVTAIAPAWGE